jgi:acyl-coenzyme A thioesterase PaaI-like protein
MGRKLTPEEKRVTELVRQRMKESKSSELLGFEVESVHDRRAIFRLDVRPRHKQIHGVVH